MSYRVRFSYGVREDEVSAFVGGSSCVGDFLGKFGEGSGGRVAYGRSLAMFFRWLRVVKGLGISPEEFLDRHLASRGSLRVEDRRWGLKLALDFSRDNPDLRDRAAYYRYSGFFLPIKLFCDFHEAPLTTARAVYGKCRNGRKFQDKPCTVDLVKSVLAALSQRDRAICMTMLQSGQSIKQVLVDINLQCDYIFREIDSGKTRIRLDFTERKGNGFAYFSFISVDAIQEIRKWRLIRQQWLKRLGVESEYLFVTDTGKPMTSQKFQTTFRTLLRRHKLWTGPLSVRTHMFRKFFESEASPPDRGISKAYAVFMMGHSSGDGSTSALDVVGGVYDHAPKVHANAVESEYAKLEPYLNVYSGKPAEGEELSDEDRALLSRILQLAKEGKIKIEP